MTTSKPPDEIRDLSVLPVSVVGILSPNVGVVKKVLDVMLKLECWKTQFKSRL